MAQKKQKSSPDPKTFPKLIIASTEESADLLYAGGFDALAFQVADDPVHSVLRPGKVQGAFHVFLLQELRQQVFFIGFVHVVHALVDGVHGGGDGIHLHVFRIRQQVRVQTLMLHLAKDTEKRHPSCTHSTVLTSPLSPTRTLLTSLVKGPDCKENSLQEEFFLWDP